MRILVIHSNRIQTLLEQLCSLFGITIGQLAPIFDHIDLNLDAAKRHRNVKTVPTIRPPRVCLLYTSDAADE